MLFNELPLIEPVLKAVAAEGYELPTPIQQKAIPAILQEKDILGCAQTGTGKTAAFAIPVLQILHNRQNQVNNPGIKALVLTPTRELAIQVEQSFRTYGRYLKLKHLAIFGGVSQTMQVQALKRGVDIIIATPGRLADLLGQRLISLQNIEILVLDEADRMLDMGFINDVKKIVSKIPEQRQTLFFSATMPPAIQQLAASFLKNPFRAEVVPVASTQELITQSLYYVEKQNKRSLLIHLLKDNSIETALVFTRTKHGADKVVRELRKSGIMADAIHGNKSQPARQKALYDFSSRKTRVLVATDIAARGIDIDMMGYVINYDLPDIPETYVHRIGRTGRAGAAGMAVSFCCYDEKIYLKDIQRLISKKIPVVKEHPYDVPLMHDNTGIQQSSSAASHSKIFGGKRRSKAFMQR